MTVDELAAELLRWPGHLEVYPYEGEISGIGIRGRGFIEFYLGDEDNADGGEE
jgi:hypothetical protein